METILNPAGGRPLKNDDVALFEQLLDVLEGVYDEIGQDVFIIYGCEITGSPGNYDIGTGYLFINGNIYQFNGDTGVSLPLTIAANTTQTAPRTFFDSVVRNAIEVKLAVADAGGGYQIGLDTLRLSNINKGVGSYQLYDITSGNETVESNITFLEIENTGLSGTVDIELPDISAYIKDRLKVFINTTSGATGDEVDFVYDSSTILNVDLSEIKKEYIEFEHDGEDWRVVSQSIQGTEEYKGEWREALQSEVDSGDSGLVVTPEKLEGYLENVFSFSQTTIDDVLDDGGSSVSAYSGILDYINIGNYYRLQGQFTFTLASTTNYIDVEISTLLSSNPNSSYRANVLVVNQTSLLAVSSFRATTLTTSERIRIDADAISGPFTTGNYFCIINIEFEV